MNPLRRTRSLAAATLLLSTTIAGITTATPAHAVMQPGREIVQIGNNAYGQTGDGTPLGARWTQISAGTGLTLALRNDGTVWAWGYNGSGQLGNNTTTNSSTPVQVVGPGGIGFLTGITQISAGYSHSIARRNDGTVWAWGNNTTGQLGNNTTTQSLTPVQVRGLGGIGFLTGITQISAGYSHSIARKSDGTVWAWGRNIEGQLGNNTTTQSLTPVQVVGVGGIGALTGITQIGAGASHSLARRSDGTVWSWGSNSDCQLGAGGALPCGSVTNFFPTPSIVAGSGGVGFLTGITQISAGASHNLARRSDGTVWAWGRNVESAVGDGTGGVLNPYRSIPALVLAPGGIGAAFGIVEVSAGNSFSLARKVDGSVLAWGFNGNGQLGDGTFVTRNTAVQSLGITRAVAIDAGDYHTEILRTPSLTANPTTIAFGTVRTNSTTTSTPVTITNNDTVTVIVNGVTPTGTDAAAFDANGPALPAVLAPGQSITLTVTATTDATARTYSAQLTLDTDQPEPFIVPITLKAVDPTWSLGPTAPSFPATAVGDAVTSDVVTVTNSGLVPVTYSAASVTGANATDYAVATNTCVGTLAPGASCAVAVTFAPKTAGTRTAALTVVSDGGTKTLALSGVAKNPADLDVWLTAPGTGTAAVAVAATANITNLGPSTAKAVSATVTLSAGGTFASVSGTGWSCAAVTSVQRRCTRTFLNSGAAANLTINAAYPAGAATITVVLDATTTIDLDPTDNTASRSLTIT